MRIRNIRGAIRSQKFALIWLKFEGFGGGRGGHGGYGGGRGSGGFGGKHLVILEYHPFCLRHSPQLNARF